MAPPFVDDFGSGTFGSSREQRALAAASKDKDGREHEASYDNDPNVSGVTPHTEKMLSGGAFESAYSRQNPAGTPKRLAFNCSDRCPYTEEELAYYRKHALNNPVFGDLIDSKSYSPASKRSKLRTVLRDDLRIASQKASEKAERQFLIDNAQNEEYRVSSGEKAPDRPTPFHPGNTHPDDSFRNSPRNSIQDSNQVGLDLLSSKIASLSMCPDRPTRVSLGSSGPAKVRSKTTKKSNGQPFLQTGLGKVPPEIREIIWEHVLVDHTPFNARDLPQTLSSGADLAGRERESLRCAPRSSTLARPKNMSLALVLTCRLIHQEAQYVFDHKLTLHVKDGLSLLDFL